MPRFYVSGSNMQYIGSLDTIADSEQEAIIAFKEAMGEDLATYCWGEPSALNLDNPPSYAKGTDFLEYFQERFEFGRISKTNGYCCLY